MKAICTSYTETDKGLVLRNNWVDNIDNLFDLQEFLSKFVEEEALSYVMGSIGRARNRGEFEISSIIEGKMDLDNVVIHIRIIA